MPEARWVRRRFRVPEESIDAFTAELWRDRPLGIELRSDLVDVYYREGEVPAAPLVEAGVELMPDEIVIAEDWLGGWRSAAAPFALGERFWIDPGESATAAVPGGRIGLHLPARRAFGTGSHASTRLAVRWLERIPLAERTVLDIGAGTGILSFVAARLGARRVVAIELDLESVLLAGANRRSNAAPVALVGGTIATLSGASFDLVVANLLSSEVAPELPAIAHLLAPGGELVYSGALATERDGILALIARNGLVEAGEATDGEWMSWRLRRQARPR